MNNKKDIKPIAIILIVVGFLFYVKLQFPIYKVSDNSMLNQFREGNVLLVNKFSEINKGDVVVFRVEDDLLIARIIANSGDKVQSTCGILTINDDETIEPFSLNKYSVYINDELEDTIIANFIEIFPKREYLAFLTPQESDSLNNNQGVNRVEKSLDVKMQRWSRDNFGPFKIKGINYYWLMNDNRSNIKDSRKYGLISNKNIVGKVVYVF